MNSPIYSEQLALDTYWKGVGGLTFLPGTNQRPTVSCGRRFYSTQFRNNSIRTTLPACRTGRMRIRPWPA